jgi:hypothetical protein
MAHDAVPGSFSRASLNARHSASISARPVARHVLQGPPTFDLAAELRRNADASGAWGDFLAAMLEGYLN